MEYSGLYHPELEHDACGIGFIADLGAPATHRTLERGLEILCHLEHRGGAGADPSTGDGAGVLMDIPHEYFLQCAWGLGFDLPQEGRYGTGLVFLPQDEQKRSALIEEIEAEIVAQNARLLGWREVGVEPRVLGESARPSRPHILQLFVVTQGDGIYLERDLFLLRRGIEERVSHQVHFPSLSHRIMVYKGLLLAPQIKEFYLDLQDSRVVTRFAVVHQRYSTNTAPSWERAQPFRFIAHNGEINTHGGNCNWMRAKEGLLRMPVAEGEEEYPFRSIPPGLSDSGSLDAAVELLYHGGRSLHHCMSMLVPPAWEKHQELPEEVKAFFEYHSFLQEPWDGPAAVVFCDGVHLGALLDRNGLRPARYTVTRDGEVVFASEVGVLPLEEEAVLQKQRVAPGSMLLLNLERGEVIRDEEIKKELAARAPYAAWIEQHAVPLKSLLDSSDPLRAPSLDTQAALAAFGYTEEELRVLIQPLGEQGLESVGSMGSDTPLAVYSSERPLLFNYFKQLFAQVTNPPLDAIREELVTSLRMYLGRSQNLLSEDPLHCQKILLDSPVVSEKELAAIASFSLEGQRTERLSLCWTPQGEEEENRVSFETALERLLVQAEELVRQGVSVLILSDRETSTEQAALPSLLATAAVHHHLLRTGLRMQCSLVIDSAEPREVHHLALLFAYGASAVCPYLCYHALLLLRERGDISEEISEEKLLQNCANALAKGVRKTMSKIGISTLRSYHGAQMFEAVGLSSTLIERHFTGTHSRIQGAELADIAKDTSERFFEGLRSRALESEISLALGGEYRWRRGAEQHLNDPHTVALLQHAVRKGSREVYQRYSREVFEDSRRRCLVRGMLEFEPQQDSLPIEEVESVESIYPRFKTGAMSFGSISIEAHAVLAIAMNRIGGRSNTGEGGEDEFRYKDYESFEQQRTAFAEISPYLASILQEGDSARSAIKQVASGRFGVTSPYLVAADELQIKIAQGAKPGEGGQLPGHKVDAWIAKVRNSTPGVGLISPPPHHDIYSIEDIAQLIYDLKNANDRADVSVKLVSALGVGTVAAGVAKAKADTILVSGADGGTGASPLSSIKHAGLPWELGLAEVQQVLLQNGLRSRVRLEVDGQLKTGRDIAVAALLGAEEFGFATAPLIASGCIMMRKCHLNTCPVGVATQDASLREKFMGHPDAILHFMRFVAEELRELMALLGFRTLDEMIGRVDCLRQRHVETNHRGQVDLSPLLKSPNSTDTPRQNQKQVHGIDSCFDMRELYDRARPALEGRESVVIEKRVGNMDRSVGTRLGSEVTRRFGASGLAEDTLMLKFRGSAGQSFGAFVPQGMTLELRGDANDYVGKGLSGGKIILSPPKGASFTAKDHVIVGNVVLYGATSGEAYISGKAGERFCVRNSGATAVVEGVGEHGCEYMTGGRVVILGEVGRNFAAGMSGGLAYVLDEAGLLKSTRCNTAMVALESVEEFEELEQLKVLIQNHWRYTESAVAASVLANWKISQRRFVKVIPHEYRDILRRNKSTQSMTEPRIAG